MGYRFSYGRAPTVIMGDGQLAIRCGWDFQWEHEQGLSSEFGGKGTNGGARGGDPVIQLDLADGWPGSDP